MIYNPETANSIAVRLNAEAQSWLSIYTRLNGIIGEMDTAFISQTQAAFHAANESNQHNYVSMKTLLEEMAAALTTAQNNMTEADETEAGRIRSRFGV